MTFLSYILLFLLCLITAVYGKNGIENDTLAVIGKSVITADEFMGLYKDKIRETGLTDNLNSRKKYLENLIGDEVLIQYAKSRGLDKNDAARNEYKRIYLQELLNAWSDKHISPAITVKDEHLKELFIKMNTKIKVRHLYASSKQDADLIYNDLMIGRSFTELAANVFTDPVLKKNGGLLGYIAVDEMDPAFEEAAFSLKPGQISKPVKTVYGYSIIKVDDIKANPLITENEFLKAKERLRAFARKRIYEQKVKEISAQISGELKIRLNDQLINKIYENIHVRPLAMLIEDRSLISSADLKAVVVNSSRGDWDLKTLIEELSIITPKQRKWIRTEENLKEFITGVVNRKYLAEKARDEKLNATDSFNQKVQYSFDTYLLTTVEDELKERLEIPRDTVFAYYINNKDLFSSKPEIRLSSILLDRADMIDSVKKALQTSSFEDAAGKYSIQSITAEKGGDIGYYKKEDLDFLGEELFALKIGEWKGPIEDNGKYVFIKCTGRKDPVLKPFEECSAEIEEMLLSFRFYSSREGFIESVKKQFDVRVYPGRLSDIKLNQI